MTHLSVVASTQRGQARTPLFLVTDRYVGTVIVVATLCWLLLLAMPSAIWPTAICMGGTGLATRTVTMASMMFRPTALAADLTYWGLMVGAMMLPLLLPMLEFVRARSFAERRTRATFLVTLAYMASWILAGVTIPLLQAGALATGASLRVLGTALFLFAAAWRMSRWHSMTLRRCAFAPLIAPYGWRADLSCLGAGARAAKQCIATCLPMMAAGMSGPMNFVTMVILTQILFADRATGGREPRGPPALILTLLAGMNVLAG